MITEDKKVYTEKAEAEPDLKPQFIAFPPKVTEVIKTMEVGQSLDISNRHRASTHSLACRTFPEADFKTKKHDNKIYLVRTA